jgi:hypothetical protein
MAALDLADENSVVAMTKDERIGMKGPHRKLFIKAWKARVKAAAVAVPPQEPTQVLS